MAKDGRKVAVGAGIAALITGIILATRVKAAPPPPPPGLANLYGKVTDAETGEPIQNVVVTLDGITTYTGSGGNYVLTNLEPGAYILTFEKEGYETVIY